MSTSIAAVTVLAVLLALGIGLTMLWLETLRPARIPRFYFHSTILLVLAAVTSIIKTFLKFYIDEQPDIMTVLTPGVTEIVLSVLLIIGLALTKAWIDNVHPDWITRPRFSVSTLFLIVGLAAFGIVAGDIISPRIHRNFIQHRKVSGEIFNQQAARKTKLKALNTAVPNTARVPKKPTKTNNGIQ